MQPAESRRGRYPGAQSFADDALSHRLFFGRDPETTQLTHRILANRVTVLFARSGLGKTSLINAGVSQRLREHDMLPLVVRVCLGKATILESVLGGIDAACHRCQGLEYLPGERSSLWRFLQTTEFWRDDQLLTPVLVLDQFEELFTLRTPPERAEFLDELSCLVRGVVPPPWGNSTPPTLKLVLSLREDFLAHLEELADRLPGVLDQRFRLLPLTPQAAALAIDEPASLQDPALATAPFVVDPAARDAIIEFLQRRNDADPRRLSASMIEPFQLQLICQHIEDIVGAAQAGTQGAGRRVDLKRLGGEHQLRTIFKHFFRRQVDAVPGWSQRRGVRRLCSELLINSRGRRLRVEESEIRRLTRVRPDTLERLVERRLLRREQTSEADYYELSHDSLVVPVLDERRMWLSLKLLWLAVLTLIGLALTASVSVGVVAMLASAFDALLSDRMGWEHLALIALVLSVVGGFTGWVIRSAAEARETLRRLMLNAKGRLNRARGRPG